MGNMTGKGKGWDYAPLINRKTKAVLKTKEQVETEDQRNIERGALLAPLSSKARRIAGKLFDSPPEVRAEVLNAFKG